MSNNNFFLKNWRYWIVALFFIIVGLGDFFLQSLFLSANYRLPYFNLAVFTFVGGVYFAFSHGQLCPSQSAGYRKLALAAIPYFFIGIIGIFVARDPARAQLLVYLIGLLTCLFIYLHKDSRLLPDLTPAQQKLNSAKERKYFYYCYIPVFIVFFALQISFFFHVQTIFEIYFNPLQQFALGFTLVSLGLIFTKTRLDTLKVYFLALELIILALSVIYFFVFAPHFHAHHEIGLVGLFPTQVVCYVIAVAGIAISNLFVGFGQYKSFAGVIGKIASIIFYLDILLVCWAIANAYNLGYGA